MTHNSNSVATQVAEVFADSQNLAKSKKQTSKKQTNTQFGAVVDSRTNRRVAVAVIDSILRGFKANCKAIYTNRTNTAVARLLAEKGIKPAIFADFRKASEYIHTYGKDRFINQKGEICTEKVAKSANTDKVEYYAALGYDIRFNEDKSKAVALVPCSSWSVSQFINLFGYCSKVERKQKNQPLETVDEHTVQAYLAYCLKQVK